MIVTILLIIPVKTEVKIEEATSSTNHGRAILQDITRWWWKYALKDHIETFTRNSLFVNLFYEYMFSKDFISFTHHHESTE
jgi:hypothetical protein